MSLTEMIPCISPSDSTGNRDSPRLHISRATSVTDIPCSTDASGLVMVSVVFAGLIVKYAPQIAALIGLD